MAEEFDKSEQATPFKLQEARKKGQVAKSMEFSSMVSLVVMLMGFLLALSVVTKVVLDELVYWLRHADQLAMNSALLGVFSRHFVVQVLGVVGSIIGIGVLASVVASYVYVGPVFSFFPLKPDFSKLNPKKGFEKIFARRTLVELAKLVLKLILFTFAAIVVWHSMKDMMLLEGVRTLETTTIIWQKAFTRLILGLLLIYVFFALFDLWYSKMEFGRQMRMSRRDLKDEYKRREGNPEIKSKRKKTQQELVKKFSGLTNLKQADVVITNPTHIAVALKYRAKSMVLPEVVTKGSGFLARLIRLRAQGLGIPMVQDVKLARKLYKETELNSPIPLDTQYGVADIYKSVAHAKNSRVFS